MTLRRCTGASLWALACLTLSLAAGCETILPPLRGEIAVGEEAYAVFVGGEGTRGDLYALAPDRGVVIPITYSAVAELAPSLSPDGTRVALLRAVTLRDSVPGSAWVLHLGTGAERELALPRGVGTPRKIGWAADGGAVFVRADSATYRFDASGGERKPRRVVGAEAAAADSSFAVLLGDPVLVRVVACEAGQSLCVVGDTGTPELLARDARDPVRWGSDSVAYFVGGGELEVRPLGPGWTRRVEWTNPPPRPRSMTFFPGQGTRSIFRP